MSKQWLALAATAAVLVLLWAGSGLSVSARPSAASLAALTPVETAQSFYTWYLGMLGNEVLCHPLLDGAYRHSPYLSSGLIAALDEQVADACDFGPSADPFLCGVDEPQEIRVLPEYQMGDSARVIVRGGFLSESDHLEYRILATASLIREDGHWTLDGVTCR